MHARNVSRASASLVFLCATVAWVGVASADIPDVTWNALKEREVVVTKSDRSTVMGKLIGVEAKTVAVMKADGIVVVVDKSAVADVRGAVPGVAPPPMAAPPPPISATTPYPPAAYPPPPGAVVFGPSGMMPPTVPYAVPARGRFMELALQVEAVPAVGLVEMLGKRKAEFAQLDGTERYMLMTRFKETLGSKAVGFLLNWIIFPGTGSIYQGDKGFGYPLLLGGFMGLGFMVGGAITAVQTTGDKGLALAGIGAAIYVGAAIIGMIRPWLYEGIRYSVLRDFYAHPERYGTAKKPSAPTLLPTLIAQPIGLPDAEGRAPQSGTSMYGAGFVGSF